MTRGIQRQPMRTGALRHGPTRRDLVGARIDAENLLLRGTIDVEMSAAVGDGILQLAATIDSADRGVALGIDDRNRAGIAIDYEYVTAGAIEGHCIRIVGGLYPC